MVWATMDALTHLVTVEQVARERDVDPASIPFRARQEVVRA
jgi:hypothetical protein